MKLKISVLLLSTLTLFGASTDADLTIKSGKSLILNETTNTYSLKLKAASDLGTNIELTLPKTAPKNDQVMVVNSSGVLSWIDKNATGTPNTDAQKIDKFELSGSQIKLSLENDGESDKSIDLSTLTTFLKPTDIVDNLTSTDTNKPLSANQGKVLKTDIDANTASITNLSTKFHLNPGTAPSSPTEGDIYMDSSDKKVKVYDGSAWVDLN